MRSVICVALLLAGCVTASPIQPIGNGLYTVTADSQAPGASVGSTRTKAISSATDFCAQKSQSMVMDHADDHLSINHATTVVTFRCK